MSVLDGKKVKELKGHKWTVKDIKFNQSRNLLMTLSSDAIQLWNMTTFDLVKSLFSKAAPFTAACFSADGQSLFTTFQVSKDHPIGMKCRIPLSIDGIYQLALLKRRLSLITVKR